MIEAARRDVTIDPDTGCWTWQRTVDRDGYARVSIAGRYYGVHRLVLGNPDGPVVHHVCANRACVNPTHLQPVTHRENIAEMLERNHYLNRITHLQDALRAIDPTHPALG